MEISNHSLEWNGQSFLFTNIYRPFVVIIWLWSWHMFCLFYFKAHLDLSKPKVVANNLENPENKSFEENQ